MQNFALTLQKTAVNLRRRTTCIWANGIRSYTDETRLRGFKSKSAQADFVCIAAISNRRG